MANRYNPLSIHKLERKTIEKNRRNNMKILYSHLSSLLPHRSLKETGFALTDQIDDAIDYIKNLQIRVEEAEEKKKQLLTLLGSQKREQLCHPTSSSAGAGAGVSSGGISRSAEMKIREVGPTVDVAIICGLGMNYLFNDTIRVLHQEGAEIVTANSSRIQNSFFYTFHAKVKNHSIDHQSGRITERLEELIYEQRIDDLVEEQPAWQELWKLEDQPYIWEFEFPQGLML